MLIGLLVTLLFVGSAVLHTRSKPLEVRGKFLVRWGLIGVFGCFVALFTVPLGAVVLLDHLALAQNESNATGLARNIGMMTDMIALPLLAGLGLSVWGAWLHWRRVKALPH